MQKLIQPRFSPITTCWDEQDEAEDLFNPFMLPFALKFLTTREGDAVAPAPSGQTLRRLTGRPN